MNDNNPIPIPPKLVWREFTTRYLPVMVFVLALTGALALWRQRLSPASIPGEAEGIQAVVNSPETGILTELNVRSFQEVKAGALLGKIVSNNPSNATPLLAPIDGAITYLYMQAGDKVKAGFPVLLIGSTKPDRIVAFLRQPIAFEPAEGAPVIVRARARHNQPAKATVQRVGSQLMTIRASLLPGSTPRHETPRSEMGLPLIISVPPELKLYPGEIVDLTLLPKPAPKPEPPPPPTKPATNSVAAAATTNAPPPATTNAPPAKK